MSPVRMPELEAALRLVLEFNEAFNPHDVAGKGRLLSEDTVFENTWPAPDGARYSGKDAVTRFWEEYFRDPPHAHIEIEQAFGLGKGCVMRWQYSGEDSNGQKGHVRGDPRRRGLPGGMTRAS